MAKLKKPLLFILCLLPIAVAAGIFVGYYQLDVYSEEIISQLVDQLGSSDILILVGVAQTVGYALFCGFFGYILANRTGLWKPIGFEKRSLLVTLAISVAGGIVFSLDYWVFGSMIEGIQSADAAALTFSGVMASILYGGVIEEIMLRLFFMTLTAFVIWKTLFRGRNKEHIPEGVPVAANVIAALLFAASHLPATLVTFGELTPMLLLRCFLLNGGFGLVFGWLYRKYGIVYSILSHAIFHIVSKFIWFIFI